MKIFDRSELQIKLSHFAKISKFFALIGAKGVGKSTLIRHWLNSSNRNKSRWITLTSSISIFEKITTDNHTNSSLEEALEQFSQNWSQYDAIIWDDFHLLPNKHLFLLISFIKNSQLSPLHIFITDENLNALKIELPFILCEPLSETETKEYLVNFLEIKTQLDIAEVHKATGGLPYLLNLWSQSSRQNPLMSEAIVSLFSEDEKQLLSYLYFVQQLSIEHPNAQQFEKLYQKFYIQKMEGHYTLQSYLVDIIEIYFPQSIKKIAALMALEYLRLNEPNYDHFCAWMIALKSDLIEQIVEESIYIEPKHLENISKHDLQIIFQKCSSFANRIETHKVTDKETRLLRQVLQTGILLGERKSTLEKLKKWLPALANEDHWSEEKCWFSYELIYWFHRANQFDTTKEILEKLHHRAQGELKYLTQLELAFPFTNSDPKRALQTLNRVTESLPQQKTESLKVIYAQALLQIATCYFNLENRPKSLEVYTQTENLYEELHQPYFAMICRINRILHYINSLDIEMSTQLLKGLFDTARKFGYNYQLSGAYYLQSLVSQENFDYPESLFNIDQALALIPEGAPPKSSHYLLQEKINILINLGKYREAERIFNEQLKLKSGARTKVEFSDPPFEEAQETWAKANKSEDNTDYLRFLLLHGQTISPSQSSHFQKSLLGRWALLENKLASAVRAPSDQENLLKIINQMEEILKQVSGQTSEKIALQLLRFQFKKFKSADEKQNEVELLRKEMQRWPADLILKSPLNAILETLTDDSLDLESHLDWKGARQIDRGRWINWLLKANKSNQKQFLLTTAEGKAEIDRWEDNIVDNYALVLIEHLGMVYFQNIEIKEFHRKAVLRQLLAFVLEIFPSEISKAQMAHIIWGEAYSPSLHDARIYTSIQRLRQLLTPEAIESWNGGYRWNTKLKFAYIKSRQNKAIGQHKIQTMILQVLQNYLKSGTVWISRSELVEATQSSESTVKRELSKLLQSGEIIRKGSGPSVMYALFHSKP
jgi:hypothetical protein